MIRRAKLYARINAKGSFQRIPVEFDNRTGKPIVPVGAVSYAVRVGGKFEPAGRDLSEAVIFLRQKQAQIGNGVDASNLIPILPHRPLDPTATTVSDAADRFISDLKEDVEQGKKAKATLVAYGNAVSDFRNHCGVVYLRDVTASVLLMHEKWLRKNLKRRNSGHLENTLSNRFRYLNVFLKANGIKMSRDSNASANDPGLLNRNDVPKEKPIVDEEKAHGIRTYTQQDVAAMMSVATEDEKDLIQFALRTGFRDGEIEAAEWSDIDWTGKLRQEIGKPPIPNIITGPKVPSKFLPTGFRTKNKKFRKVEIPSLIARLKARQKRAKESDEESTLIFSNGGGRVNTHLVRIVQSAASRAEENGFKISGKIGLHRFRKTYATVMLANSDIETVALLLGHEDINTTRRYLGVDRTKAAHASKTAFKGFGD